MGRGAPNKPGLEYFPKMLNFYDDDKIFDLMDEYGPLGVTVYDVILTIVYSQGYYAELSKAKLSRMVIRKIGNKWVKGQKVVVQVIDYCAELGLLSKDLLQQNIITSEGIQKRYYKIAVKLMKRQLYTDRYWLLENEKTEKPLLNAPLNGINSEENQINSEEISLTSEESAQKEKESKYIKNNMVFSPEVERAFQMYLLVREANYGKIIPEQIQALREELTAFSSNETEQLAIVKKATARGLKGFEEQGKKVAQKSKPVAKKNSFNNFQGREYDSEFMKRLAIADMQGGDNRGGDS